MHNLVAEGQELKSWVEGDGTNPVEGAVELFWYGAFDLNILDAYLSSEGARGGSEVVVDGVGLDHCGDW